MAEEILILFKQGIELLAIWMIFYGALLGLSRVLWIESRVAKAERFKEYENAKRLFLQKLILALDFFVVSTLIDLVLAAGLYDMMRIALIVAIRTVLSWSVGAELHPRE